MVAELVRTEVLRGTIARVTFQSDNGFVVLKISDGNGGEFTANGTMPNPKKGCEVELKGSWRVHPKHGERFNFTRFDYPTPTGEAGVIAFLSTLKGVGESIATRIVDRFGAEESLKLLEEEADRLLEIKGISPAGLRKILSSYQESRELQKLIVFLGDLDIPVGAAHKLWKAFGDDAIAQIKANPYGLSQFVHGFGFKKCDEFARGLGIENASPVRLEAGVLHILRHNANLNGHCYLENGELCNQACDLLALPGFQIQSSDIVNTIASMKSVDRKPWRRLVVEGDRVYLQSTHEAEVLVARKIKALAGEFQGKLDEVAISDWIADYEQVNDVSLAKGQREAIVAANTNGFAIVTGGAGVGKSTVSKAVIELWFEQKKKVVALAPTGKAAQRIREATGLREASTIHRALKWNGSGGFLHNKNNPLEGDAFLIDESSMIDIHLAKSLLDAIPAHAIVLLVGDVNQLPSVGEGNFLRDVIESGIVPVVRLTEIFRQGKTSSIIQASLAINEGKFPALEVVGRASSPKSDAWWFKCDQASIAENIEWLIRDRLPEMGWSRDDIQVLAPMHKTDSGNIALNSMIQDAWNLDGQKVNGMLRVGDRVIQTRNNYTSGVFNGDIGVIKDVSIDPVTKTRTTFVLFPDLDDPSGRLVPYQDGDLGDLMLAYSISIHRSQGSEFPVTIIPASMQHYMMLQRNLFYTGITRGKRLVILVGEEGAIAQVVRTNRVNTRNTGLRDRLSSR